MNIFETFYQAKDLYRELKKWENSKLYDLPEQEPSFFSFRVGFSEKYAISISTAMGFIETALVDLEIDKLTSNKELGYSNRYGDVKKFNNIAELKNELIELYNNTHKKIEICNN